MSRVLAGLIVLALTAAPAFAQAKAPAAPAKPASGDTKSDAQRRDEAAAEQARVLAQGQSVNTRIELTITDARGDGTPITKTVSMMTADRSWGRIRTQGEARSANGTRFPVILNVDARPTLLSNNGAWNRARVELTIEYRPADEAIFAGNATRHDTDSVTPNINESLAVILEDGKPLLISQSADPVTDRKVKVEAKLAIIK